MDRYALAKLQVSGLVGRKGGFEIWTSNRLLFDQAG